MFDNLGKWLNRLKSNTHKFYLEKDFSFNTNIPVGKDYSFGDGEGNEVMHISKEGIITVRKGFKWDGCSPKIRIGDIGYIGTPDGTLHYFEEQKTWKPKCYYGTCIHDPCYKFKVPYSREQVDKFMLILFMRAGFSQAELYHSVVRKSGHLFWKNKELNEK